MNRIIYTQPDSTVAIIIPANSIEEAMKDIPEGADYEVVPVEAIPSDRLFRHAWKKGVGAIVTDLPLAAQIAHEKRRAKRNADFAPLDTQATIPSQAAAAEAARQAIRDADAVVQTQIDAATTEAELKAALVSYGAV